MKVGNYKKTARQFPTRTKYIYIQHQIRSNQTKPLIKEIKDRKHSTTIKLTLNVKLTIQIMTHFIKH